MTKEKDRLDRIEEFTYKIFSIFTNVGIPVLLILIFVFLSKLLLLVGFKK